MRDHERTLKNDYDDVSMKARLILTQFSGTFGCLKFDEKSFFKTLLGFAPFRDNKPTNAIHADRPSVYTSDKFLSSSKM